MKMRYYKTIQITLTETEYQRLVMATTRFINETGTPVSVTKYAKAILKEEVDRKLTEE